LKRFNLQSDALEKVFSNPIPGLHIVANLEVADSEKLTNPKLFQNFINQLIATYGLTSVGEVFHKFDEGGWTGVICLTESHLSVHTWPENRYLTFDIFLSNYTKDNRQTTLEVYDAVVRYFEARILNEHIINR
jgi:S-adenosylmethionine decarboxylase